MGSFHTMLPRLTMNRQFVEDFLSADVLCFAMGVIEERRLPCGFLALRTAETIPSDITNGGFNFSHSVFGTAKFEVVHFAFEFYNFQTFNALVNPNNLLAQTVLRMIVESGEYFFFAISPSLAVTAFKTEIHQDNLSGKKANLYRINGPKTADRQYARAIASFIENPQPAKTMLNWVALPFFSFSTVSFKTRTSLSPDIYNPGAQGPFGYFFYLTDDFLLGCTIGSIGFCSFDFYFFGSKGVFRFYAFDFDVGTGFN